MLPLSQTRSQHLGTYIPSACSLPSSSRASLETEETLSMNFTKLVLVEQLPSSSQSSCRNSLSGLCNCHFLIQNSSYLSEGQDYHLLALSIQLMTQKMSVLCSLCPCQVSCCDKALWSSLGREGFIWLTGYSPSEEAKAGTQRPQRQTADRLAPHGFLSLLS